MRGLDLVTHMLHGRFVPQPDRKASPARRIDERERLPYKPRQTARRSVLFATRPRVRRLLIEQIYRFSGKQA